MKSCILHSFYRNKKKIGIINIKITTKIICKIMENKEGQGKMKPEEKDKIKKLKESAKEKAKVWEQATTITVGYENYINEIGPSDWLRFVRT